MAREIDNSATKHYQAVNSSPSSPIEMDTEGRRVDETPSQSANRLDSYQRI